MLVYDQRNRIVERNIGKDADAKGTITASIGHDQRLHLSVVEFEPVGGEDAHWVWRRDGTIAKIPTKPFKLAKPVIERDISQFSHNSIPGFLEGLPEGWCRNFLRVAYKEHNRDILVERSLLMATCANVFFQDFLRVEEGKELIEAPYDERLEMFLLGHTLTVKLEAEVERFLRKTEVEFLSELGDNRSLVALAAMAAYDIAIAELARGYKSWLDGRTKLPDEAKTAWPSEDALTRDISKIESQRSAIHHLFDEVDIATFGEAGILKTYKTVRKSHAETQKPAKLSQLQNLLLCGLRLSQLGLHRRHSPCTTLSMVDLNSRGIEDWVEAQELTRNDSFWEEAALYLQTCAIFRDHRKLTKDDLQQETDAVLRSLRNLPLDKAFVSDRFSGQQRLVIVCFAFDINVPAPEFPNRWCDWTDDDLDELAELLPTSATFVAGETVDSDCVRTWLEALETLFAF
ncbi:hypothetical protein FGG08_003137 [Glutinoglossum americanum]|uniref:Uncharacterized protein n=1 Tax=Glutinoglossum americanum TaxID=1670608 RepID=A0A9P8HYX0_9PEZI|nr:hypothetical protein FGG08_003137 [Glutinoglossum americanum]